MVIAVLAYFPVFYSNYLYTDEAVQLWYYRPGSGFTMFMEQGRYITEKLLAFSFSTAETVSDLKFLRIFSLCGWVVVIPIWFSYSKKS